MKKIFALSFLMLMAGMQTAQALTVREAYIMGCVEGMNATAVDKKKSKEICSCVFEKMLKNPDGQIDVVMASCQKSK